MSKPDTDSHARQRRRMRGGRLLLRGMAKAEVARQVGVSRTSVSVWSELLQAGGLRALGPRPLGRPPTLSAQQQAELLELLKHRLLRQRLGLDVRTLCRVGRLIEQKFGRRYGERQVMRILLRMGFAGPVPTRRTLGKGGATSAPSPFKL